MVSDITERSFKMPRNAAILYPKVIPSWKDDPPDFSELMITSGGQRFWVNAWRRTVKGREVLEIRQGEAKEGGR